MFFSNPASTNSPVAPPFRTDPPLPPAFDPRLSPAPPPPPHWFVVVAWCPLFFCWWCCCCSCNRQWILNQFDRRPYLLPLLDMPTSRHFLKRHALHAVRFFLLITHSPLFLHSEIDDKLLYVRPKNDCNGRRVIEKGGDKLGGRRIRWLIIQIKDCYKRCANCNSRSNQSCYVSLWYNTAMQFKSKHQPGWYSMVDWIKANIK